MKMNFFTVIIVLSISLYSCSKKSHPAANTTATTTTTTTETKTVKVYKPSVPKVITVNDKTAKRSVDGRYYYDLDGHRYWRNNSDGKYYLFNKAMFDNPDFKSTKN
jgi:hypothetical protein